MLKNRPFCAKLYNTAPDAKSNPAYARGIVVGALRQSWQRGGVSRMP